MESDTYKTIEVPAEGLYKEKGSKFLSFLYHVETEDEVKQLIEKLRKEYHDARHHCYAYILGTEKQTYRANDDGEPSGTAGRPIHGQLLSFEVTNVLLVVVRYFGGVLLGASGLANAYKIAAREALSAATIIERTIDVRYELQFRYEQINDVMKILKDNAITPKKQKFDMECSIEFAVRKMNSERILKAFENLRTVQINEIK